MISKSRILQTVVLAVILGTVSFLLKRYANFDFKSYTLGILMGFIVFILLKDRKTGNQ